MANYKKKVSRYEKKLENYGDFSYKNQPLLDSTLKDIANRKAFNYDSNTDTLYNNYVEQYKNLGKAAMKDTVAQGAALTGGYDNSYAQSAGQQAYNDYASKAGEVLPTLYNMAMQKYQTDSDTLNNKYSVLSNDRSQALNEYQDKYSRLSSLADYYANQNQNAIANKLNANQFEEQKRASRVAEKLSQAQFDEQKRSNRVGEKLNQAQFDEQKRANAASEYSTAVAQAQKASQQRIKSLSKGIKEKFNRNKDTWTAKERGGYIANFVSQASGVYTEDEIRQAIIDAGWNLSDVSNFWEKKLKDRSDVSDSNVGRLVAGESLDDIEGSKGNKGKGNKSKGNKGKSKTKNALKWRFN